MSLIKNIDWANDSAFPAGSDPWSAAPNKTEPSTLRKDQGFIPEAPFNADELNWWMNAVASEVRRIDGRIDLPTVPDMVLLGVGGISGRSILNAHYNPTLKLYFAMGIDNAGVGANYESKDGQIWSRNNDYGLDGVWLTQAATNELGTTVFASNSRIVWTIKKGYDLGQHALDNGGDDQFVKGFAHTSTSFPDGAASVVYDPVSGQFFWVGRITGSVNIASYSTDGSTWTNLFPSVIFDGTFPITKLATNGNGRIIALQSCRAAPNSKILRSDDGGVTWTAGSTLLHTYNPADCSLDFTASGEFIASFYKSTGDIGEVWSSVNNGVSWSKKTSFTAASPLVVVGWGNMWVGAIKHTPIPGEAKRVSLALSRDKGDTWTDLPNYYPEFLNLAEINGRLMLMGFGPCYMSQFVEFPLGNLIT